MVIGVPMTSAPAGGVNFTSASATGAIALAGLKIEPHGLAQLVLEHHALELATLPNAELRFAKIRVASLGRDQHPVEPVASCRPARTVNNSRMLPSPESRPAGVAVSAAAPP